MALRTPGPVIRSGFPRAGSLVGDQKRDEFEAAILDLLGDPRLLWLPRTTETTTSTDRSRNALTVTYDATVASRYAALGSGLAVSFDGTQYGELPDSTALVFGNGAVDTAMSIIALIQPTTNAAIIVIASQNDNDTTETWDFFLNASGQPRVRFVDESATASLSRRDATAFGTSWGLLTTTYDGSGSMVGVALYKDGLRVDDVNDSTGTYVAMEDVGSQVRLGTEYTTHGNPFQGSMALLAIGARALSAEDNWRLKVLVNAYFDLSL